MNTTPRHELTREQFAARHANTLPTGLTEADVTHLQEQVADYRLAIVNHYFTETGEHRGVEDRLPLRKTLEAKFKALVAAARASRVLVAA